jgi:apolipoprotein D and lipocalin family protein
MCARDTAAEYRRGDDGMLAVVNSCTRADGGREDIEGRARVADPATNARLEVTFVRALGTWWFVFGGDYVVVGLDPDYQWALVAHPSRKYGWILARTPSLPPALLVELSARLAAQDYDPCAFVLTAQSGSGGPLPAPRLCDVAAPQ